MANSAAVAKASLGCLTALSLLPLAGCKSIGPGTVARDRFEYSG